MTERNWNPDTGARIAQGLISAGDMLYAEYAKIENGPHAMSIMNVGNIVPGSDDDIFTAKWAGVENGFIVLYYHAAEIGLKSIFALNKKKNPPHRHALKEIYDCLDDDVQNHLNMVFRDLNSIRDTNIQIQDVVNVFVHKDDDDDDVHGLIKYGVIEKSKGHPYHDHLVSVAKACVMFVRYSMVHGSSPRIGP